MPNKLYRQFALKNVLMFEIVSFLFHYTHTYIHSKRIYVNYCTLYNKLTTKLYECSKNGQIRNIGTCPHKLYLEFTYKLLSDVYLHL